MSETEGQMVELKCTNCGSKITATEDEVQIIDNVARIKWGNAFYCDGCGSEFEENTTLPFADIPVEQIQIWTLKS